MTARTALAEAAQSAEPFARYLGAFVVGSYRRMKASVGDVNFLAASTQPEKLIERFVAYREVRQIVARGPGTASVVLACGIPCDLRVVAPESFGAALHFFTGSRAHNNAIASLGLVQGIRIDQHGVFSGGERIAGDSEEAVYAAVGLPYIAPELREDEGEIEAAMAGKLPRLVAIDDLAGDLHVHTRASDGRSTLAEMVEAARLAGLQYVAITDHSRRIGMAHGLDAARLARQGEEIDAVNASNRGIHVLKGVEVDILGDGTLDLPDASLAGLDLVVAAVHDRPGLPRSRQTARILAAMDNPLVAIVAHASRCDVDMPAIVRKARERGIALELDDAHCRIAKQEGALVAIDSEAQTADAFTALRYAVGQARRGWLTREDVLNTRPFAAIREWIVARKRAALHVA